MLILRPNWCASHHADGTPECGTNNFQLMDEIKTLVDNIVKGIQEKKGTGITVADLNGIDGTICKYFVICQGNSPQQVDAIADSVEEYVRLNSHEKPIKVVGRENSLWVAMDYVDVIVHVFVPETRQYYDLDNLWQDARITQVPDLD